MVVAAPVDGREETEGPMAADAPCCTGAKRDTAGAPGLETYGVY